MGSLNPRIYYSDTTLRSYPAKFYPILFLTKLTGRHPGPSACPTISLANGPDETGWSASSQEGVGLGFATTNPLGWWMGRSHARSANNTACPCATPVTLCLFCLLTAFAGRPEFDFRDGGQLPQEQLMHRRMLAVALAAPIPPAFPCFVRPLSHTAAGVSGRKRCQALEATNPIKGLLDFDRQPADLGAFTCTERRLSARALVILSA